MKEGNHAGIDRQMNNHARMAENVVRYTAWPLMLITAPGVAPILVLGWIYKRVWSNPLIPIGWVIPIRWIIMLMILPLLPLAAPYYGFRKLALGP